jgi:hypothetical protein
MTAEKAEPRTTSTGDPTVTGTLPPAEGRVKRNPAAGRCLDRSLKQSGPLGVPVPKGPYFRLSARPSAPAFPCPSSPVEVTRLPSCYTPQETIDAAERYSESTSVSTSVPFSSIGHLGESATTTPSE